MFYAHLRKIPAYLLLTVFLLPCISAQEVSAVPARLTIPDGTPIHLQLAQNVSSEHARIGDRLDFVVVKDVSLGGFTVIPAGTMATGSVTRVRGRRFLGIGGRVALKLDSLELANGDQLRLRARLDVKGRSRTKLMAAAMIATGLVFLPAAPVFLLTRGHESTVVKSTELTAQIDGASSVLSAGLVRAPESYSELDVMMDHLPPRVFSGEGREGDMLNLVFVANQEDLQHAFARAGWVKTDNWKPVFVWHLLRHRTNDAQLPMARFYLFGRVQDYSYALPDPNAIVSRRHHIRIWKTQYTVDGTPLWAASASYDAAIEFAKHGRLVNHTIDPQVDTERDFVGTDLAETSKVHQKYVQAENPVFEAQTASGEAYHSDSRILLVDLHQAPLVTAALPGAMSGAAPPISIVNLTSDAVPQSCLK